MEAVIRVQNIILTYIIELVFAYTNGLLLSELPLQRNTKFTLIDE